jgi:serine/threonine-protein kinase
MAEDLRRFLDGKSVAARPPGPLVQAAEWCRSALAAVLSANWPKSVQIAPADSAISRQTETSLDRAVTAWLDGDDERALREIAEARRREPKNVSASLLASHIRGDRSPFPESSSLERMAEGLRMLDQARPREALERFDDPSREGLHPPLAAALLGLSAAQAGQLRLAEKELAAASRRLTSCLRIHRELGDVYMRLSRFPEAEQACRHASSLAPKSPAVWRDLASVYEKQGNIASGLEAAGRAGELQGKDDAETQRIVASLKDQAGERDDARAILEQLVERDPEDYASRHLLGLSLDRDHRIAEAAACYGDALEIRPSHAASLINLAYLHSGALTGKCRRCDQAFAENPECLDLEKAEHCLLRALEEDRGADAALTRTAVDVALRLEHRTRIIALLEELTRSGPRTPEVLQLEHTLRALRIAEREGDPGAP